MTEPIAVSNVAIAPSLMLDVVQNNMIETRHKDKKPKAEPYAMNATEVSRLLEDSPQFSELLLCFTYYSTKDYRDSIRCLNDLPIKLLSIAYRKHPQSNPYNLDTHWYVCISTLTASRASHVKELIVEKELEILNACRFLYCHREQNSDDCAVHVMYNYSSNGLYISCVQNGKSVNIK